MPRAGDIQSAINAAGGQLPTNLPSPPSYKKVNPADSPILVLALTSASLPLTVVDDSAENILTQQLSQISGVAQITVNGQQKPRGTHSARPREDRIAGSRSRGRQGADRRSPRRMRRRAPSTAHSRASRSTTTTRSSPRRPGTTSSSPTATARRFASATSAGRWTGRRTPSSLPGRMARACILLAVFKQPGANVIDTVDQVRAALPHLQATIPAAIDVTIFSDRTADDPRLGRRHGGHPGDHHRPGGRGDLPLSAHRLGDDHPRYRRAAVADRDIRGDVSARLQPRQPLADGARRSPSASWWTMPSSCWRTSSATSRTA